ncbi:hypothetical protein PROVRETT_05406 [Providencia rettgeri DSM 1131]|nr:hypothetical protein PROVRETT_05406 [Providencia rettgeri DSM 1131]
MNKQFELLALLFDIPPNQLLFSHKTRTLILKTILKPSYHY